MAWALGRDAEEKAAALGAASERLKIAEPAPVRLLEAAEKRAREFSLELPLEPVRRPETQEPPGPKGDESVPAGHPGERELGELFVLKDVLAKPADAERQLELLDHILAYLVEEKRGHTHGLLERAARGLMEGAGLDRVVYLRLTPDGKFLEVKGLYGDVDARFQGLLIAVSPYPNAFAHVLEGPPWLWIHEKSPPSEKALITPEVLQFFPSREIFVGRVGLSPKILGVLAGGRQSGQDLLDDKAFQAFRRVCDLTALGMALLRP